MKALSCKAFSGVKGFEHKKCPFCHSKRTKKNGTRNGKQRYRCQSCRKQFEGGNRLNAEQLWQLYTQGKQTAEQLAKSFGRSRKTISRYLQKAQTTSDFAVVQTANILMDTTYFDRQYGIMVLYDSISKQALFVAEVRYESNVLYLGVKDKKGATRRVVYL